MGISIKTVPTGSLAGTVTVNVTVSPTNNLQRVDLFVDGVALANDSSAPYSFSWNTLTVQDGIHVLRALATYTRNPRKESTISVIVANGIPEEPPAPPPPPPPPPPPEPTPDTTAPSVPRLSLGPATDTTLRLDWLPAMDNVAVDHYNVYRGTSQDVSTQVKITEVDDSILTYTHTGLTANTDYSLGLEAVDAAGNKSSLSQAIWFPVRTAPGAPPAVDTEAPSNPVLSLGAIGDTTAVLNWQAGVDNVGVHHYNVYRGTSQSVGDQVKVAEVNVGTNTYTFTGLTAGTSYSLGMEVVDAAGNKSNLAAAIWYPVTTTGGGTPPVGGTQIRVLSDLTADFAPNYRNPAVSGGLAGGGLFEVSTPYGPGFRVVCNQDMPAPWDSTTKVVLAQKFPPSSPVGLTERWSFNVMMPAAGNTDGVPNSWVAGLLWQWHTDCSSGHHLALYSDRKFRIGRQTGACQIYDYAVGPTVVYDTWYPVTFDIKWSRGSDGRYKVTIAGVTYMDFFGQTVFDNGDPYLQFGYYAQRQFSNEVRFGGIVKS